MKWKSFFIVLLTSVFIVMFAAVGILEVGAARRTDGKICVVNEPGGSETPYNRLVAEGVRRASKKFHLETVTLDAETVLDLGPNIETFAQEGDCDLIVLATFEVASVAEPYIAEYPEVKFTVIDAPGIGGSYPNLAGVTFKADQAGFLVGYIAAHVSTSAPGMTGKVATFGGMPIPPVTDFMYGYWMGVDYYNIQYGTEVQVLGVDPCDPSLGLFTDTFSDPEVGWEFAAGLYQDGADIIFPVAGLTGFGALDFASDLADGGSPSLYIIGVDTDWSEFFFRVPEDVVLTSALKKIDVAVYDQIALVMGDFWQAADYYGSLANDQVGYAPLHHNTKLVDGVILNELKGIIEGIIDESIPTSPIHCE